MNLTNKKILFIDPLLQKGHLNFNNIYIESLRKSGYQLNFVFVAEYESKLNVEKSDIVYTIPKFLYQNNLGKICNRIVYFISLILVRMFVDFKNYDAVIFSSFEEISFFFSNIKNAYLINHINVSTSKQSNIKYWFLDKVIKRNSLIVLDDATKNYLLRKGDYNILVQPHGLAPSKKDEIVNSSNEYYYIFEIVAKFNKIIFSPSKSSLDDNFIDRLMSSDIFLNYLEKENALFIFKGDSKTNHNNILSIDFFLSPQVYDCLFLKSDVILVAYPNNFNYRVSGVLFECMSNSKPCAVSKIDTLIHFSDYFNYNPFYSTINELIQILETFDRFENKKQYYKNLTLLEPNFNDFF
jgi:hypothetical protein